MRTYAEVRDAVSAFMADRTEWTEQAEVAIALSSKLGVPYTSQKHVGMTGDYKTLDGQIRRALNRLAADGRLVKRTRKARGYGRSKVEFLPAAQYDLQTRQRMDDAAAQERQRQADQELLDGFAKLGWTGLGVTSAGQLTMTRTVAGRILSALEMHQGERARPGPTCPHGNVSRVTCNEC